MQRIGKRQRALFFAMHHEHTLQTFFGARNPVQKFRVIRVRAESMRDLNLRADGELIAKDAYFLFALDQTTSQSIFGLIADE